MLFFKPYFDLEGGGVYAPPRPLRTLLKKLLVYCHKILHKFLTIFFGPYEVFSGQVQLIGGQDRESKFSRNLQGSVFYV